MLNGHSGWVRALAVEGRWLFRRVPAAPSLDIGGPTCAVRAAPYCSRCWWRGARALLLNLLLFGSNSGLVATH